jgi:hypothetical protein
MKTSSTVFGDGENKSRDCKDTGAGSGACASSECNYKFATMCRATSATVLLCTHGSGIPYNHVIQLRVLMDWPYSLKEVPKKRNLVSFS